MTVLVSGASGMLGSRVVTRLLDEDVKVRAVSRDPERLADARERGVEVMACDLRDESSVRAAVSGVTSVLSAAHALAPPSRGNSMAHVDGEGTRRLIAAAEAAGAERFVLSSVLGADPSHPVTFWRLKGEAEELVAASSMDGTALRMGGFLEMHAFEMLGRPILEGRRIVVPGRGDEPRTWVSADDAADVAVDALLGRGVPADNDVVTVACEQTLSTIGMVVLLATALDREPRVTHLPVGMLKAGRAIARGLFPPVARLLEVALLPDEHGEAVDQVEAGPGFVAGRSPEELVAEWVAAVGDHPAWREPEAES